MSKITGAKWLQDNHKPDLLARRRSWKEAVAIVLLLATVAMVLPGCANSEFGRASSGAAVYSLESTDGKGKSCKVTATSAREIQGGAVKIGKDCTMEVSVDSTQGMSSAFDTLGKAIEKIPGAQ